MLRMMWQLMKTALVIRELISLGMFAEVRVTRGTRGLNSQLFVNHHGICSIMSPRAAVGLCAAVRREMDGDEGAERVSESGGRNTHGVCRRAADA